MNEVIRAICERRSIRSYKPDPVAQPDLDEIVKAGLHAASARNIQPWHITVVKNRERIDAITAELKVAIVRCNVERYLAQVGNPKYTVNFGAPVFMLVSADPTATRTAAEDCALVLGNMFLAAHSLGIGSCWVNQLGPVCDDPKFRALLTDLGVPPANQVIGSAAFGYNAGPHPAAPARREGTVNYVE